MLNAGCCGRIAIMTIRVVTIDDQEVVRAGLSIMLSGSRVQLVGQAGSVEQAAEQIQPLQPDVVLLDVLIGGEDGLELLRRLRDIAPGTRFIIFTGYDNPTYVARAAALGASEYVLKSVSRKELLRILRKTMTNDTPLAGGILAQMSHLLISRRGASRLDLQLTTRELQVLRHLALGLSNREIASSLDISGETVKEHVQNLLRKLNATDRTQAAVWAVRWGLA